MIELVSVYSGGDIEDSDGAWECFEITVDGEKVGDVTVKTWSDGSSLIERIDIDEDRRGLGYGSDAIRTISDNFDKCFIVPDNADAARLYARIGRYTSDDAWMTLDQGFGVYEV